MDTIILVPGGGGSALKLNKEDIWPPTFVEIVFGYQRISQLKSSKAKVTKVIDVYPPMPCYEVYRPLQDDLNLIANHFGSDRIDFAYG